MIKDLIYRLKKESECLSLAEGKSEMESDNKNDDDSKSDQIDQDQALNQSGQKQQSQAQNEETNLDNKEIGAERKRAKIDIVNNKCIELM